jgi:hypothetical protein
MLLISVRVSSPPPPGTTVTLTSCDDDGVDGRWLASTVAAAATGTGDDDGAADSSFSRSSEDVDVDASSGDTTSRCVVIADTLALTVDRSPGVDFENHSSDIYSSSNFGRIATKKIDHM